MSSEIFLVICGSILFLLGAYTRGNFKIEISLNHNNIHYEKEKPPENTN